MPNEAVKLNESKAEWQQKLSPMEYSVTREKGTERAFSGRASLKFEPQKISKT